MEPASGLDVMQAASDLDNGLREPRGAATAPTVTYVYALGRVRPQFSGLSIEKEFAQALGTIDTAGMSDSAAFHAIISDRSNRYLARALCWVLAIEGLETYLLVPRDAADLDLLVEAVRPRPYEGDLDVVIGVHGPTAPPALCNGMQLPVVYFDQLYSFDRESLIREIRVDSDDQEKQQAFEAVASDLFDRVLQLADNMGATDEHRALNYLAVRYPAIYLKYADMVGQNYGLSAVEVLSSRLSGARTIVDVIFSYSHRQTDVTERYFVRVDVTEEFPFLTTKLGHYYNR